MRSSILLTGFIFMSGMVGLVGADDQVFSGPQVGESMPPFVVRGVFDEHAGKDLDFVTAAAGKPIVLIFVHDANRPSIGLTRTLSEYTTSRVKDGLATGIVWLSDDATEAESTLKRIRHALAPHAPVGISPDGREGPGSYGLNRNVELTILVGKAGTVTANFALIQPSLQADLPKIIDSIVAVAGGKAPPLEALIDANTMMRGQPAKRDAAGDQAAKLRPLLAPLIKRDASDEEVDKAAEAIVAYLKDNAAARQEVGRIANTIVSSGKLQNYGTPRAQQFLKKWAKQYGTAAKDDNAASKPSGDSK